jgi:hypothetical protein
MAAEKIFDNIILFYNSFSFCKNKKMENKKYFILILFTILLLSFLVFQQFRTFKKNFNFFSLFLSKTKPEIKILKIEPLFGEKEKKTFQSQDGKLKFSFARDWQEIFLKDLTQTDFEGKVLFLAQKINLQNSFLNLLIVQEFDLENKNKIKKIIDILKEKIQKEGGEIENFEILSEKRAVLGLKYKEKENIFLGKGMLILIGEKIYLINVLVQEKSFLSFQKEIEEIFNSIEVVD